MIEQFEINHHIQKHIISVLMYRQFARFSDLRPPKTDTNLFSYHLGVLQKAGFVEKQGQGYTLSQKGLTYVDRVSGEKLSVRTQPKIISMLLVQNSNGDVLLQKRNKQPYIDTWTLPYGKLHIDDVTIVAAAKREAKEKLGLDDESVTHVGDAYIRVTHDKELLSTTFAHVFRIYRDDIALDETTVWARPHKLSAYRLAPAVEAIVTRSFFGDDHFFEEFDQDWYS